jgi:hypothetical protein
MNDPKLASLIAKNPFCMPISIAPNDNFFGPKNQNCMNYIRNLKILKNCRVETEANAVSLSFSTVKTNFIGTRTTQERITLPMKKPKFTCTFFGSKSYISLIMRMPVVWNKILKPSEPTPKISC